MTPSNDLETEMTSGLLQQQSLKLWADIMQMMLTLEALIETSSRASSSEQCKAINMLGPFDLLLKEYLENYPRLQSIESSESSTGSESEESLPLPSQTEVRLKKLTGSSAITKAQKYWEMRHLLSPVK